jgi:iron complex transport system permease protein
LIGFVGLIIPHMIRLLIGPDHRWLLPASALGGASLLMIADSIARVVVLPAELPTGILTALLGAPFFVALLIRQRGEF